MDWEDVFTLDEDEETRLKTSRRKYLVVVVFDISDDKRRYKMGKMLSSFGYRVQRSAFECILTLGQYEKLVAKAEKIIDKEKDLLRIYKIAGKPDIVYFGDIGLIYEDDLVII